MHTQVIACGKSDHILFSLNVSVFFKHISQETSKEIKSMS